MTSWFLPDPKSRGAHILQGFHFKVYAVMMHRKALLLLGRVACLWLSLFFWAPNTSMPPHSGWKVRRVLPKLKSCFCLWETSVRCGNVPCSSSSLRNMPSHKAACRLLPEGHSPGSWPACYVYLRLVSEPACVLLYAGPGFPSRREAQGVL